MIQWTELMKRKQKKSLLHLLTEFAKLQLAGYIPFWGKYLGFAAFDNFTAMPTFFALLIPMIFANILFFIVDEKWVFSQPKRKRQTGYAAAKFALFIIVSELVVLTITYSLYNFADVTPYIGQFISGIIMAAWTFFGLRFWVFKSDSTPKTKTRRKARSRLPKTV